MRMKMASKVNPLPIKTPAAAATPMNMMMRTKMMSLQVTPIPGQVLPIPGPGPSSGPRQVMRMMEMKGDTASAPFAMMGRNIFTRGSRLIHKMMYP
jgi:hypothetical protein